MDGANVVMNHLKMLGAKANEAVEKAVFAGAEIVRDEIEKEARIKNLISPYDKKHMVDYIIISKVVDGTIDIGPASTFFYARFLELGTVHQKAQPFIEPAFLRVKSQVEREIQKVIRKELGLS